MGKLILSPMHYIHDNFNCRGINAGGYQGTVKTSKMLGSVSEGAVDEECMAEAK